MTILPEPLGKRTRVSLKHKYRDAYGISDASCMALKDRQLQQLEQCKDNAARRILLGTSSTCRPKGLKAGRKG